MTYAIVTVVLLALCLLLTMDNSWMNVLMGLRNDVVFAARNKLYGAFQLRQDYNKRLAIALVSAVIFFCVAIGAPYVISKLTGADVAEKKQKIVDVNLELFQDQPPPPPPPEVIPPEQPKIESVQFVAVEATDKPVEEPPPTQADLKETNAGETTQEGEKIDAPPVVVEETTYDLAAVQEQPEYPGGAQKMYEFFGKIQHYPDMEFDAGIEGRVYVGFTVDKDGSIEEVKMLKSISEGLDKEAMRMVKAMPKWNPGKMNGKAVKVHFSLPVGFKLK